MDNYTALFALSVVLLPPLAGAAGIDVQLKDRHGRPVADAVITAIPSTASAARSAAKPAKQAVMDQVKLQFVPRVLAIEAGTVVTFPNSDNVAHQVYSFSPPKQFQLALYRGSIHPTVTFDKPGLVVLGCNIHDSMIGYIYVSASPWFGKTDGKGTIAFADLPPGDYEITAWSPEFNEPQPELERRIQVAGDTHGAVEFSLSRELKSAPRSRTNDNNY